MTTCWSRSEAASEQSRVHAWIVMYSIEASRLTVIRYDIPDAYPKVRNERMAISGDKVNMLFRMSFWLSYSTTTCGPKQCSRT